MEEVIIEFAAKFYNNVIKLYTSDELAQLNEMQLNYFQQEIMHTAEQYLLTFMVL
jgi:hypothetical protein